MKKVKIGVVGGYRGSSMINYCKRADNAEVVAICDNNPEVLAVQKENAKEFNITFYDNFEDFIKHDMDAVVLANYAHEHAPFAIRAMKEGKHVFSEVLPVQTMKQAVELVEAVEETGKIYAYGENYCYMPATYEMKLRYKKGEIGEFEYGEGEYIHNCESIWPSITYGEKDHWRNMMYSTFYCTHSLGPLIHITGLRPVSVIGIENGFTERKRRVGCKAGGTALEIVTLENGAVVKSIHGGLYTNSIWYSIYGGKGHMESGREAVADLNDGYISNLTTEIDEFSGKYAIKKEHLKPEHADKEKVAGFGHGGSDYLSMYFFVEKILGNPDADTIDVYEALDMFLPGMFAYRSILDGSMPKKIPNLRNKEERDAWRNDTACTDPKVAGDMLLPTCPGGTPEIDDAVYDRMKELWEIEQTKKEGNYRAAALNQGNKVKK